MGQQCLKSKIIRKYLDSEDSDSGGKRNLPFGEPHRGYSWRDSQNKHLRNCRNGLSNKCHCKTVRIGTETFNRGSQEVDARSEDGGETETFLVQQPSRRENQGNVDDHENHGEPVNGRGGDIIEGGDLVGDCAVGDPLELVYHGIWGIEDDDYPSEGRHWVYFRLSFHNATYCFWSCISRNFNSAKFGRLSALAA